MHKIFWGLIISYDRPSYYGSVVCVIAKKYINIFGKNK